MNKYIPLMAALLLPALGFAADKPPVSELQNPLAVVLLVVIIALLLAIGLLAFVVTGAAQVFLKRWKEQKSQAVKTLGVLLFTLAGLAAGAQEPAAQTAEKLPAASAGVAGMSAFSFYTMVSIIGLELLVILVLLYFLQRLLRLEQASQTEAGPMTAPARTSLWKRWWYKANSFTPVSQEADIELSHNYDGIRELDNRLPPWWLYGFYITIIFSGIYLWRYHVGKTAPLSEQELAIAMQQAEIEKEAYLKTAASKVDENTVTLLTDGAALESGKKLFTTHCAACHGADGGGTVGPNLADGYWLHGGDVKSVFKTIKYGVQEKGMKSWKDDFSPVQIAHLASYIKSLQGSKPANPKEPQGEPFKESSAGASADTGRVAMQ